MTEIPHILVACTVTHAERTAMMDLDWRLERLPNGLRGAINKDGEFVRFTSSFDISRGYLAEGRKLYLGYNWIFARSSSGSQDAIDWWEEAGGEVIRVYDRSHGRQLIQAGEV